MGPDRPFEAQDSDPLSFQPKYPPPFPLEKCANDPRGEDRPLVCRHPHGACTKARLRLQGGGGSQHCLLNVRESAEGQGPRPGWGRGGQIQPSIQSGEGPAPGTHSWPRCQPAVHPGPPAPRPAERPGQERSRRLHLPEGRARWPGEFRRVWEGPPLPVEKQLAPC